jgi:hypothetical protein
MQFYKIHIFSDLRDNAYIMFTPVWQNTNDYFDKGHIQLKIHKVLN